MLQAGRSRVPFPTRSPAILIDLILLAAQCGWVRFSKYEDLPAGKRRQVREDDNLCEVIV
jgi:hypothetical protein